MAGVLLCALYSILLYLFVGLNLFRSVFIAYFLIRDLEHLAASKFWLLRDEGRTVMSIGLAFRRLKVPFLGPRRLLSTLLCLSNNLSLLRVAALLVDTAVLCFFSLFIEPKYTSALLHVYSGLCCIFVHSYPVLVLVSVNWLWLRFEIHTSLAGLFFPILLSLSCMRLVTIWTLYNLFFSSFFTLCFRFVCLDAVPLAAYLFTAFLGLNNGLGLV